MGFANIWFCSFHCIHFIHHFFFFHIFHIFFLLLLVLVKAVAAVEDEANDEAEKDNAEESDVDPANFHVIVHNFNLSLQRLGRRKYERILEIWEAFVGNVALVGLSIHRIANQMRMMYLGFCCLTTLLNLVCFIECWKVDGPRRLEQCQGWHQGEQWNHLIIIWFHFYKINRII